MGRSRMVTAVMGGERNAFHSALPWLNAILLLLVVVSAFSVIHSTHACRQLYAKLQELESSQWYLQEDYGRLMLEQSTWASPYRVEKVARGDLGMVPPAVDQLRVMLP